VTPARVPLNRIYILKNLLMNIEYSHE